MSVKDQSGRAIFVSADRFVAFAHFPLRICKLVMFLVREHAREMLGDSRDDRRRVTQDFMSWLSDESIVRLGVNDEAERDVGINADPFAKRIARGEVLNRVSLDVILDRDLSKTADSPTKSLAFWVRPRVPDLVAECRQKLESGSPIDAIGSWDQLKAMGDDGNSLSLIHI